MKDDKMLTQVPEDAKGGLVVEIDGDSGFCFGVVNAIEKAEEELGKSGALYCLGDIVHNNDEVERLRRHGLTTISHEDFSKLKDCKVLLRAHGEPPETYQTARANGIELIDATCPVVLKLQERIKKTCRDSQGNSQVVIYGQYGHAEVNGLVGQTNGTAIVIESARDLDKIDFSRDISLYSQTTKSPEGFSKIIEIIRERIADGVKFEYFDTICRQVSSRVDKLKKFASSHDLVLFVAGSKSSNGKILFHECLEANPNTRLVSTTDDVEGAWLENIQTIGICGATSTPRWLMEEVKARIISLHH